jgi:hypothetical protein
MIAAGDLRRAAQIADDAMGLAWADYAVGNAASEDRVTERLATRLQDGMDQFSSRHGYVFRIRPLQASAGKTRLSEESLLGADFVVVLSVDTAEQQLCSGWIGQAKLEDKVSWSALRRQCRQMNDRLPGLGWAVIYARNTSVIPAQEVASVVAPRLAASLRRTSWKQHFEDFFAGRVGDRRACALLRTGFIRERQRRYGVSQVLRPNSLIVDMYYGSEEGLAGWAEGRESRLAGVEAHPIDLGRNRNG